jgi:hypothetical protein
MANYNKKISNTRVRIGEVRFSYCHLFEKYAANAKDEPKYSMCVLIPKKDKKTLAMIESAIEAAKAEGPKKTKGWPGGKVPKNLSLPLRDGDEEDDRGEEFEGMYFFNCSAHNNTPGVRVLENGKSVEAMGDEDVYSGCWGAVSVTAFAYDSNGNKGVSLALDNVIKTRDDERLSGGTSADADFADMCDDDDDDLLN